MGVVIMNIAIIGVGGVGGYFGGKLAKYAESDPSLQVYFIARNEHLAAIQNNGLFLTTEQEGEFTCHPALATDQIKDLPMFDACLICVKGYDLANVLQQLNEKVASHTYIIPLLNGVDIDERIRALIKHGLVFPSCVYIGTHIDRPGHIVQNGGSRVILTGADPQHPEIIPGSLLEIFSAAGINYRWCENPYTEIWSKYTFIAAFGMVTACEDKTLGQVLDDPVLVQTVTAIMIEIKTIALKKGIHLPPAMIGDILARAAGFPYATKTSFQRDYVQKGKPNEKELFGDTIMRLGKMYGVDTPATDAVNQKLSN
jgi:2-dehydropantoate 2-reductase